MSSFIFRSLPLSADSRTARNASIYNTSPQKTYTWEPDGKSTETSQSFPLSRSTKHKKFFFLFYVFWVPFKILINAKRNDTIIFMDLETIIVGYFSAKIKGAKVFFDIVDPSSQTKTNNALLAKVLDNVEYFFARNSHRIITPHSSRIDFYKERIKNSAILKNHVVIENVPLYKLPVTLPDVYPTPRHQGKITIGYFGTLDADTRGLEWLIAFANNNKSKIRLIIAGQGNLSIRIKEISALSENIEFLGPFTHETLPHLYQEIDITWAYYSPKKELHRYAAPNKFYEHIYFKKPIIISRIIPQCGEIESIRTGIALDAEDFSVQNFDLSERKIESLIENSPFSSEPAKNYWDTKYSTYYEKISARVFEV